MSAPLSTDQLANDARCIDKCIPDGEKFAVLISIMAQILANGGTGGGGGGLVGTVTPNGNVTATAGTTYYDTTNATFWVSTAGGNGSWVQLI